MIRSRKDYIGEARKLHDRVKNIKKALGETLRKLPEDYSREDLRAKIMYFLLWLSKQRFHSWYVRGKSVMFLYDTTQEIPDKVIIYSANPYDSSRYLMENHGWRMYEESYTRKDGYITDLQNPNQPFILRFQSSDSDASQFDVENSTWKYGEFIVPEGVKNRVTIFTPKRWDLTIEEDCTLKLKDETLYEIIKYQQQEYTVLIDKNTKSGITDQMVAKWTKELDDDSEGTLIKDFKKADEYMDEILRLSEQRYPPFILEEEKKKFFSKEISDIKDIMNEMFLDWLDYSYGDFTYRPLETIKSQHREIKNYRDKKEILEKIGDLHSYRPKKYRRIYNSLNGLDDDTSAEDSDDFEEPFFGF